MIGSTKRRPLAERFWEKVNVSATDECWEWVGSRATNGYGRVRVGSPQRISVGAHRVSYALRHGMDVTAMPSCLIIRHACDNRQCVNPAHLSSGTYADNARDTVERGRASNGKWVDGRCANGHDISDDCNILIDSTGSRRCRPCNIAYEASRRIGRRVAA